MEEQDFRLFSLNTNGLNIDKVTKLGQIRDFDIFFIQETHNGLTDIVREKLERELDCVVISNNYVGTDSRGGVATLIKNKPGMKWDRIDEGNFVRGRLLHLRIGLTHYINVHVPAKIEIKGAFARKLTEYLEKYSGDKLIVGGDFNWVGEDIDRTGPLTRSDLEINSTMKRMMTLLDLTDIYRRLNLLRVGYTYTYDNTGGSRIYKFLGNRFDSINYKKIRYI